MSILDPEENQTLIDPSSPCIRPVRFQERAMLIQLTLNGSLPKILRINKFNLLTMVLPLMIVFKATLVTAG